WHALERAQFGKALADFQLVQEKLGRCAIELTAARLLVYRAAWEKDQGADRITTEAAMAKAHATETAQRAIDEAIQILGGRGVLAECVLGRMYRSIVASRICDGATELQRLIVAGRQIAAAGERDTCPTLPVGAGTHEDRRRGWRPGRPLLRHPHETRGPVR